MKNYPIKYAVIASLLVIFVVASLVTSQNIGSPADPSSQPQAVGTSSYVARSEPVKVEVSSQPVPQQVVIQFAPGATDAERKEYIESIGGTVVQSINSLDTVVVNVSEEVAQAPLPESTLVEASEADYYVSALDDIAPVNDPHYADQWALPAIGAPGAWASIPADAPTVTIAVIDSGICVTHPDLAGHIVSGWDFIESDSVPQDDFGHGCSVSGVIAANINDGVGIAGVAPNARIMPLRVLNANGVGSYSDVAAAVVYAVDNGAQVINLSLGGSSPSSTLENAINYATSNGVTVVAAAGNNGTEGVLYPAAYDSVIAVGSIDPNLQHSTFSNYGSQVDIWAPGRDIITTKSNGDYGLVSGTSFAAPYVAGAEAVYMALNRTPIFAGGVLTFETQIDVTAEPTTVVQETPTEIQVTEFDNAAVLEKLKLLYNVPSAYEASMQNIQQAGGTMFGLFVIPAPDGVAASPAAHYFTAIQNGTELTVSKEYTPQFSEALEALNAAGVLDQSLVTAFNSASAQGDGASQLSLPWTSGTNATFLNGPHGDGFEPASAVLSALDFAPVDNKVRAAREGFAQKIICPEEVDGSWVIVTHADGWRTSYYQVTNILVDVNGRQVGRGELLGDVAPDAGTAFRCGGASWTQALVHFAVLRDGKQVKIDGFDIGGWTVGGSGAGGTLTRVSPVLVANVNNSVLNSGTFGTDISCEATVLPPGYIKCSEENGTCTFNGLETVYFGTETCFADESATGSIGCNSTAFDDVVLPPGEYKSCYVDSHASDLNPACPQSGGVILYWTKDYSCVDAVSDAGYRLRATSGALNVNDGNFNDKASALRVPPGWSVMLYGAVNQTGEKVCVSQNVSDLAALGTFPDTAVAIDNNITSIQVFEDSTTCNGATLATAPRALLPANGSSKEHNFVLNFQWEAAPNAVDHQVEWWNNSTPGTKNTCAIPWVVGTSCIVSTPAAGTYSWHVKGRNTVETGWSPLWTFTIRSNTDSIFLSDLFTTDDAGPAGIETDNMLPLEEVAANAYKDTFNPGDPIKLYLIFTNEFDNDRLIDGEWQVLDPAGHVVSEMSDTSTSNADNANNSYYWFRSYAIPTDSVRGEYTFIGKITYNSVTTTQSVTFTVDGNPAVEVYDAFVTDSVGAASVEAGTSTPESSAPSDVVSNADPIFDAGDGIRLYIDTFNDVAAGTPATFNWEVTDPQGRHVPQLEWSGSLTSALNHTWWSLPATLPAHSITGDYTFTGSITYGALVTGQTQTFHVNGPAVPANDSFSAPVVIASGSVPYSITQDTWNTTTAVDDPDSTCGGFNSNSVWYRYTPASNGVLEIDTSGTTYEVEIGVWTGTVGNLTQIGCSNEAEAISGDVKIENLPLVSGTPYYIELTDVGTPGAGHLELHVDFASSAALTNDDFANPIIITNNTTINNAGANTTQDVRAATQHADDFPLSLCNRQPGQASVWYKYETTLSGELKLDTEGSDYDTMLSIWTGPNRLNLSVLDCNDDIGGVVWDTDSSLTVQLDAATTYYIQVAEYNGSIDLVSGASTDGLGGKPDSDVSAEFSGGQMHLHSQFNPAPTLNLPVDNDFTALSQPTLSVLALAGASTYQFQVSTTDDFASPLVDATTASLSYTLLPGEALPSNIYYWRARAKDVGSNPSAWSRARILSVTSLISPANNAFTSNTKPTFTWGATAGVLEYNLQVDNSADFASLEVDRYQTSGTSFTLTTALIYGDHYWRVRARTGGDWVGVNFTPAWKFNVLQPLVAPVLVNPANASATKITSPVFTWSSVPSGMTYEINIDNDATFTVPILQSYITSVGNPLTYTANTLADGTYSWRVRARNALNEVGPWSLVRTVSIDTVSANAPLLNLPVNNGFTSLSKPTLSVFASTGATKYTFHLDTEPFTNPNKVPYVYKSDVTTTSYTLTDAQVLPYGVYYWRARAKDAAGNNSLWSDIRTLTVTPMTAPLNNAFVTTATPSFTWAAATGGLEYHLQVSKADTFAVLEQDRYQPSGTSYVSPAIDYGAHYWRMQVRTAAGWGVWTPTWKFTVTPALSAAPILTSPASASLLADNTPTMTWNKVMDDDHYEIQIDNLSTFASPEQTLVSATGVLTYTAATLPDGLYYWRVRTSNYLSAPGAWSASRTFTVDLTPPAAPVLNAPADALTTVGTPAFTWLTTTTATKYQLQYANDAAFTLAIYNSVEVTTLTHTPPAMTLGLHYWHVRAKDLAGNWSAWSTTRSVTINPPVPLAPVLTAPTTGLVTNNQIPVFVWAPLDPTYTYTYEFQLSTASTFTSILQSYSGVDVSYPATILPTGVYYWRARALNSVSVAGPWAASRTITIDITPPLAPALSSPADNAIVIGTPAFSWSAAATATKYQFEYDVVSDFSSAIPPRYTSLELTTTTHTPTPALVTPDDYYWHVRAKDAAGNWSAWSLTRKVTANPPTPVAPVLTAPVASLVTNDTTPDFTWNSVANATSYELQIAAASTFAIVLQPYAGAALAYTATPLTPDGIYYWRVRALNIALVPGAWSTSRSFTVDTTPPLAPALSAPADLASIIGTPAFSWSAAATATKYQFEYDTDAGFANPIAYTSTELTTTSHTPTPAMPLGNFYWHVRAKDPAGNWGPYSAYRTVTVLPLVPPAPVLTAPTASLVTSDTTPNFTWNSVVSGDTYQIQISTASTFAIIEQDVTGGVGVLTYTASPALAEGIHYWRVRAWNVTPAFGAWSASRSFTVDSAPPAPPALTAPADLASIVGTPAFTWASSTTATKYQFEYDTDAGFANPIAYTSAELTTTSHTPTPALLAGTYYWHVRAKDAVGNWSAYTTARMVTILPPVAPALSAPADAAVLIGTPAFSWASSVTATKYQFQYDNDSNFSSPTYTSADLTTLNHTPPAMVTPGTYSWHVRAKDAVGNWSAWSTARTVTVNPPTPVAPVLTSPVTAFLTNDTTPDFAWNAVAGTVTYEIQISISSTFATQVQLVSTGASTNYTYNNIPALATGVLHYWRVRALNNAIVPVAGPWSASRTFTVDVTAPLAPVLSAPADAASNIGTPAFSWAASTTATKYQFEYDNDSNFSSPTYTSLELTTTSHTPPAMTISIPYSWHVRAKDPAGNWSDWSTARTITILPTVPLAPALTAPVNALVTTDTTPDFTWSSVVSGVSYEFQISTVSTFASTIQTYAGAPTAYTATPITPDGVYYWRVRALNVNSVAGTWSVTRSFTVDTTPPVAPTLSSPADGSAVVGTPAFSWAATATASKYEFQYDNDSNFSSPIYTSVELTTTSHTPPTMVTLTTYSWHVRAKDAAGNWGAWSTARLVTINPPTPVAPALTAPVTAFVTNDTTPSFTWNSVAGTSITYEIQVSISSTFATQIQLTSTGALTNYTYNDVPPLANALHYWRVRAVNAALVAGPWSASRTFTIDTIAPATTVLSSPADNASVTGTPAFSWTATATASKYQFQYDNNADFSTPTYTSIDLTTTNHTPPTISLGVYYWHVRAKDAAGNWGLWSTSRKVTVTPTATTGTPTLLTPASSSITLTLTPTFTWSTVTGAVNYQFQLDRNSTFSSPDIDSLAPATNFTVGTILAEGTYYWRVRKVDTYGGVAPWSAVWRLNLLQPIPLAVTVPLSALSDSFDTATPTLSWDSVEHGATYQIQVDNDKAFSTPSFDNTADTISRTVSAPLANGQYFWRVRAINIYETPGPWSETWTMKIDVAPAAPALLLPSDTSTSSTGTPAFSWQSATNAVDYQIQVDDSSNFSDPEFDDTAASTNRTLQIPLTDGKYFWRVRAISTFDTAGEWSEAQTFTISIPPSAPLLTAPETESIETTGTPTFEWESVSNGDTYQIQVDDNEDFSTPEFDDTAVTTTRELVTPLTDGTYFWRVRAMNIYALAGDWSETQTLTINTLPTAPVLLTPETNATETSGLPIFSWEAVVNGDVYQIQVDDSEDFSSTLFDDVAETTARELVTPLEAGSYYWRVRAINSDGTPGEWSLIWIVTIIPETSQ